MWINLQRDVWEEFAYSAPSVLELYSGMHVRVRGDGPTAHGGYNRKPIVATKDGIASYFASARAAARALGLSHQNITRILKGRARSAHGYTFAYDQNVVRGTTTPQAPAALSV